MIQIPGFILGEELCRSDHTTLFRGQRVDGRQVLLKIVDDDQEIDRHRPLFEAELDILKQIPNSTLNPITLTQSMGNIVLISDAVPFPTVRQRVSQNPIDLAQFLVGIETDSLPSELH